jgi:O-antigen/teichoic acid export membrane protein
MSYTRRIARNTLVLFLSQIISYVLIFFYTIYIARYLGANGYGILSFALAFSGIFSILADLGLSTLIVREVARNKFLAKKYIGNIILIKIILAILTFIFVIIFINLLGYPQETIEVVYFISLSFIFTSFFGIFYSIFQAFEKIEYQSVGQIFGSIIMFVGVLSVIYFGFSVLEFSLIYLICSIIILIYSIIIYINKFYAIKLEYDREFLKTTLKNALPFGLTGISVMLYINIDSVILSILQNSEVVGFYNAAYRLVLFLVIIPNTINIAIFPSMSKFHITSPASLRNINEKYFKFMILTGIPTGVGITLLASKIIILIFGKGYTQSIIALQILIWTIVFTFGCASSVRLLEATNKQLIITKITSISVVINILLNLFLIPKFSYIGASIATVLTEIFILIGIFYVCKNFGFGIRIKQILHDLLRIIFATFIMAVVILYLINCNLFILIFLSSLTYLVTLFVIKGINDEDLSIIKEILT